MTPLLPPGFLSDDERRPASRLEIQARVLRTQRMQYAADAARTEPPGIPTDRLATLTGRTRDAIGSALIAAGERIRPYHPGTASSGTRTS